jgi:hypothetical protein
VRHLPSEKRSGELLKLAWQPGSAILLCPENDTKYSPPLFVRYRLTLGEGVLFKVLIVSTIPVSLFFFKKKKKKKKK